MITSPEHIRRTREGIARARASGKRIGRPPVMLDPEQLRQVEGLSIRQAAAILGCAHPTVLRARLRYRPAESVETST